MIQEFQAVILHACVAMLAAFALLAVVRLLCRSLGIVRRLPLRASSALLVLAVASTLLARKDRVIVADPFIQDAGSYLTNDIAHVAISKRSQTLPDSAEILVYARQVDLTNATDWVRLYPHLTLADYLLVEGVYFHDYALPNATNHVVMVAVNFTPAPTVHTNGVWQMKGFIIPGTGKSAFPNTRIRKE